MLQIHAATEGPAAVRRVLVATLVLQTAAATVCVLVCSLIHNSQHTQRTLVPLARIRTLARQHAASVQQLRARPPRAPLRA